MIQIKGTEATSVAINVVTPSIKLDGTNANSTHSKRCAGSTLTTGRSSTTAVTVFRPFNRTAHVITSITSTAYPTAQIQLCVRIANNGSSRNGNPRSASMLPALLTA